MKESGIISALRIWRERQYEKREFQRQLFFAPIPVSVDYTKEEGKDYIKCDTKFLTHLLIIDSVEECYKSPYIKGVNNI
jgi:hypothetical protein